jgi:hypothetical protein
LEKSERISNFNISFQLITGEYDQEVSLNEEYKEAEPVPILSLPEYISPGFIRNDIYFFLKGVKNSDKVSIVVMAQIVIDGELDQNKQVKQPYSLNIYGSTKSNADYYPTTLQYKVKNPNFDEVIRVSIDPNCANIVDNAYIVFKFYSCKKDDIDSLWGVAYHKFVGKQGLFCEEVSELKDKETKDKDTYSKMVYKVDGKKDSKIEHEILKIDKTKLTTKIGFEFKTKIVSTKLTQNNRLKCLIEWKTLEDEALLDILTNFDFDAENIVIFLKDILNSLFMLFEKHQSNDNIITKIFQVIVEKIIGTLVFIKSVYRSILDEYISKYFTSKLAHIQFVKMLTLIFEGKFPGVTFDVRGSNGFVKALSYIFRFIEISRKRYEENILDKKKLDEEHNLFQKEILNLMDNINIFNNSSTEKKTNIALQLNLMKFLSTFFDSISRLYRDDKAVGEIVLAFLDKLPKTNEKILVLRSIVSGEILKRDSIRACVLPKIIEEIEIQFDEIKSKDIKNKLKNGAHSNAMFEIKNFSIVVDIYIYILDILQSQTNITNNIDEKDDEEQSELSELTETSGSTTVIISSIESLRESLLVCYKLFQKLIDSLSLFQGFENASMEKLSQLKEENYLINDDDVLKKQEKEKKVKEIKDLSEALDLTQKTRSDFICSLLSILKLFDHETIVKTYEKDGELVKNLLTIIEPIINSEKNNIRDYWNSFQGVVFSIVKDSFSHIAKYLLKYKNSEETFNFGEWEKFYHVIFEFLYCGRLKLESITKKLKKLKLTERNGDLRELILGIINQTFKGMSPFSQKHFVPTLIEELLAIYYDEDYSKKEKLTDKTNQIFILILESEFVSSSKIEACEGLTQKIVVASVKNVNTSFDKYFIKDLEIKFQENENLKNIGSEFINRLNDVNFIIKLVISLFEKSRTIQR